jgi:hypothetical protein
MPEAEHSGQFDSESLKKFAGDEWVETRTFDSKREKWFPKEGHILFFTDRDGNLAETYKVVNGKLVDYVKE